MLRTQQAGCNGYLSKPIDRDVFVEKLSEYLPRDEESTELASPLVSSLIAQDPDMVDLVSAFVDGLPEAVNELGTLLSRRDWEGIKKRVHDLKGLGGGYGYPELTRLAFEIESDLNKGHHDVVHELMRQLFSLIDRIINGLERPNSLPH